MENKNFDPEDLKALKKELEHGDIQLIALNLNMSPITVSKALRGEIRNIRIIKEAIRMAQINAKVYESLIETIKKTKKD